LASTRIRNRVVAVAATAALGAGLFAGLGPQAGFASSHREAPLTSADPQIDGTDLWAFVSPDRPDTVTLISSWLPFEEPAGGPNFYLWAEDTNYDIKIDKDGDAKADLTYRWTFDTHDRSPNSSFLFNNGQVTSLDDENLLIYQTYDLLRIRNDRTRTLLDDEFVAPSNVGAGSMPNYNTDLFNAATTSFGNGPSKSWVGQSDDPFFLDLRVFDLIYGGDLSEVGDDTLAGFNVNTLALQVPISNVRGDDAVIGIWTTASRPSTRVQTDAGGSSYSGHQVQVSRLGSPLVNEVVVPVGLKDYFNASRPATDANPTVLGLVQDPELPHVLNALYGTDVPDSDLSTPGIQRADLFQVFLTGIPGVNADELQNPGSELLRLNVDIAPCSDACSTSGVVGGDVAGFPNGRRLTDDIVDVSVQVVLGRLIGFNDPLSSTIGDGVAANDVSFLDSFPYVAYPHSGSDADVHVPAP
jgi:uncharacterized protein DUF4331